MQTLLEQKKIQWAREREEMAGLCGFWGKASTEHVRSSLLPPIRAKAKDSGAEESETSGYMSDSVHHDSSSLSSSQEWSSLLESRLVRGTPDSLLSTPEDRLKWGDRGVGVGHLWEPVIELPESRLPHVLESYRTTPKWVERGLELSNSKADILFIHHDDDPPQNKFLLGQNAPLPPEILEERERKRQKAMQHQNAIRKQLEERERKRKEEKEARLREERLEEERILREQEQERQRRQEQLEKSTEKESSVRKREQAMKDAIEAAALKAREEKKKQRKQELEKVNEAFTFETQTRPKELKKTLSTWRAKAVKDSVCQAEFVPEMTDSSSQSENMLLNVMGGEGGVAFILDTLPGMSLPLLMPHPRLVSDAATQTSSHNRSLRSRRESGRSNSSEKSESVERRHAHCCTSSLKHRSRSQPRHSMGDRPAWGINRPAVQYQKQSEKDPHYMKRLKRRSHNHTAAEKLPEKLLPSEFRFVAFQTDEEGDTKVPLKDEEVLQNEEVLQYGFRMVSNPSSPRFVPITQTTELSKGQKCDVTELFNDETLVLENFETKNGVEDFEPEAGNNYGSQSSGISEVTSEASISQLNLDDTTAVLEQTELVSSCSGSVSPEESSGVYEQSSPDDEHRSPAILPELNSLSDSLAPCSQTITDEILSSGVFEQTTVSSTSVTQETVTVYEQKTVSLTNTVQEMVTSGVFEQKVVLPANVLETSGCLSDENESSCPSSGRSDHKSNDGDADVDDSDGVDDQSATISQITALKLGLMWLQKASESRCSTPISLLSIPEDLQ